MNEIETIPVQSTIWAILQLVTWGITSAVYVAALLGFLYMFPLVIKAAGSADFIDRAIYIGVIAILSRQIADRFEK